MKKEMSAFETRETRITDILPILELYKTVATNTAGIAREANEITEEYINYAILETLNSGIGFVAYVNSRLAGEIHCYKLKPNIFKHILSELTIVVHPEYQNMGIGRALFSALLKNVETTRSDILRIELISRKSNTKAISLYEKLGFKKEGKLEFRIKRKDGSFEADVPMAWFNPNFSKSAGLLN